MKSSWGSSRPSDPDKAGLNCVDSGKLGPSPAFCELLRDLYGVISAGSSFLPSWVLVLCPISCGCSSIFTLALAQTWKNLAPFPCFPQNNHSHMEMKEIYMQQHKLFKIEQKIFLFLKVLWPPCLLAVSSLNPSCSSRQRQYALVVGSRQSPHWLHTLVAVSPLCASSFSSVKWR